MSDSCLLCETTHKTNETGLCEYCRPETCATCSVDSISFINGEFKCSHGCQYDVHEYITRKIYTTLLNGSWKEKLELAGKHIEYIISTPETITVHSCRPDSVDTNSVLGIHYTPNPDQLADEGFDCSLERENNQKYYSNTIRETAAYAWPYKPEFTEDELSWQTDYVFFEIPKDNVFVSSYRFLDFIQGSGKWSLPLEKYDEELTFTPDQLFEICNKKSRPADPSTLLIES